MLQQSRMLQIVCDTSFLLRDPSLRGSDFLKLVDVVESLSGALYIPEVARIELIENRRREISSEISAARDRLNTALRKLIGSHEVGLAESRKHVLQASDECEALEVSMGQEYTEYVESRLGAFARWLPCPAIQHIEVVKRISKRLPPFEKKDSDRNYRDYLLWESVARAEWQHPEIILLAPNARDFTASTRKGPTITVVQSVEELLALEEVSTAYTTILEARESIIAGQFGSFDLRAWLKDVMVSFFREGRDELLQALLIDSEAGTLHVNQVGLAEYEVDEVIGLHDGKILLKVTASLLIAFTISWDSDDLRDPELQRWLGVDYEPAHHDCGIVDSEGELTVWLEIILTERSVSSWEVSCIESPEFGFVDYPFRP